MIVVGTAGHIDHGKSAIIKRLTGTDPDRLPEERARGMTIDLGFAFYEMSSGKKVAFVDVPGHERFVRNMIAGAGGIDAVMLVVAADDGWMPQSQEHFQITRLLGVKHGVVVINKIDLVETEWLQLLKDEIRDKVAGSFLADAPIIEVSAETGSGFDRLAEALDELGEKVQRRKDMGKARLFIDRSFIRPGMGGVVTGTLRGGSFSAGQAVAIWPSMITGKIRTLQSASENVTKASPGQRTAISFTGIDKDLLDRGGVVTDRLDLTLFRERPVLALGIEVLTEARVPLTDRRRVLAIIGTTGHEGEIRIFDRKEIPPGEQGIVFFRPENPFYTLVGDHLIIRLPSPMVTLGGGVVLDHLDRFPRRKLLSKLTYLKQRSTMSLPDLVMSELEKLCMTRSDGLLTAAEFPQSEISLAVEGLERDGELGRHDGYVYHVRVLEDTVKSLTDFITLALETSPHLKGLPIDQIQSQTSYPPETLRLILQYMSDEKIIVETGELYNIAGRDMSLKGKIRQAHDEIMAALRADPYAPPHLRVLAEKGKDYQKAIKFILDTGEGYKVGSDFLFFAGTWNEIVSFVRDTLNRDDSFNVAAMRERFGFTRKFAIPILEETDRIGLT
ncbi:MAG: selenocysteine-specific translation elongation factor, partial [Candidatus Zixiibacteriota bacterium]